VVQKLEQVELLAAENDVLKLRTRVLEKAVEGREEQVGWAGRAGAAKGPQGALGQEVLQGGLIASHRLATDRGAAALLSKSSQAEARRSAHSHAAHSAFNHQALRRQVAEAQQLREGGQRYVTLQRGPSAGGFGRFEQRRWACPSRSSALWGPLGAVVAHMGANAQPHGGAA
jgi:hypothetical protein